jgi:phage protein D
MGSFRLFFDGTPADDALYERVSLVEVEENVEMPSAMQLTFAVGTDTAGDLTWVNDPRIGPLAKVAVVAAADEETNHCIFDGVVLSHKLHLDSAVACSTLKVWGQDSSWLMNMEEKVREWANVTDSVVASSIFGEYGISPAPENSQDDSPSHTEDKHTLMQRATDIQFLRMLARRNGKLCRVVCTTTPGVRTGYFARPKLDGSPAATLTVIDPVGPTNCELDFEWDVSRPSAVKASQALFDDPAADGVSANISESGLTPLDERALGAFAAQPMTVVLTTPVDDAGELTLRAQAVLGEGGWFARCEGEIDAGRLNTVLRAGSIVMINSAGALNSGKYYVWNVRHSITTASHTMKFVLVRNAVGPRPAGGAR